MYARFQLRGVKRLILYTGTMVDTHIRGYYTKVNDPVIFSSLWWERMFFIFRYNLKYITCTFTIAKCQTVLYRIKQMSRLVWIPIFTFSSSTFLFYYFHSCLFFSDDTWEYVQLYCFLCLLFRGIVLCIFPIFCLCPFYFFSSRVHARFFLHGGWMPGKESLNNWFATKYKARVKLKGFKI